jgi:hypothetical protein
MFLVVLVLFEGPEETTTFTCCVLELFHIFLKGVYLGEVDFSVSSLLFFAILCLIMMYSSVV